MNIYKKALYDKYFINSENIHKALDDSDWLIRTYAIEEENATSYNMYKALEDWCFVVREAAISHPKTTFEIELFALFGDEDWEIKEIALKKIFMRLINFYH